MAEQKDNNWPVIISFAVAGAGVFMSLGYMLAKSETPPLYKRLAGAHQKSKRKQASK